MYQVSMHSRFRHITLTLLNKGCCFFSSGPHEGGQEVACEATHMFEVWTDSVDYSLF